MKYNLSWVFCFNKKIFHKAADHGYRDNPRYHSYSYAHERSNNQGPVVQSIVSLTKSLVEDWVSFTVLTKLIAVIFFAKKM